MSSMQQAKAEVEAKISGTGGQIRWLEKLQPAPPMARRWSNWQTQYPELVVFDADLAGATMTKGFAAKPIPERFFDMGIAECNMTGVAAGMSTCGFKPFTNTFAIFASGRAWEQVRNSIGYPAPECQGRRLTRRSVRRRGRRDPSVHRGSAP